MLRRASPKASGEGGVERITRLLTPLCRYLNENELFYVFTGELALKMLGCAEEVNGVELMVNLTPAQRDHMLNFLSQEDFAVVSERKGLLELRHRPTGIPMRVRMAGGAHEVEAIAHRVPITLGYLSTFIPSTEDFLLSLLESGEGDGERAAALYLKWRNFLDMEHLLASARSLGLHGRLMRMMKRVEG